MQYKLVRANWYRVDEVINANAADGWVFVSWLFNRDTSEILILFGRTQ